MAAGSIVVDLLMRTGSFETDSKRAQKSLRDLNRESLEFAKGAAVALAGLAGSAAAAFFALERGASAIGKFKDLGDVIGDTGEAVASLQTASAVSGVSIDEIADISVKLTKALSKVDDESEGAAKALTALGIPLAEFKRLSPVQQIDALSKALAGFKDDKGATEAMEALVRGGSRLIPLLKELREQGGPRVIITQEQIDAADRFADSAAKLKSQVTQLGQSVLADLLPPFQAFVDEIGEADKALSIFNVAGSAVRIFFETITVLGANVIFVFNGIGREIGGIAAQLVALATLDFRGFNAISEAMKEDAAKARAELDRFEKRILTATQTEAASRAQRRVEDRGFDPRRSINTSGLAAGTERDDAAKKLLDNRLKALEAAIKREQQLLTDRNRFLDLFNGQGLVSIQSYYDAQVAIIEAATTAQRAALTKQLAELKAFQRTQTKPSERTETQTKIDEVIEKRSRLEQESSLRIIELSIKKTEEERKFSRQIETTRASVLELEGGLSKAAAIRFDQQNFDLVRRLTTEGNEEGLKLVETLRAAAVEQARFAEAAPLKELNASLVELQGNLGAAAAIRFDVQNFSLLDTFMRQGNQAGVDLVKTLRAATIAQAEFNRAAADTQRIFDQLGNAEARVDIGRKLGATTELAALQQIAAARQKAVAQLEAMVQAQEAIAKASGNPALIQNAERARIELEQLAATADPIGDKFRTIFEDAGATGIEALIENIGRGKDALKAFGDSVTQQINRIVSQNISQALFGKDGPLGFIGTGIGELFGGGAAAGAGAGAAAAQGANTVALGTSTAAIAAFTTALTAATAVVATSTASGGGDFASNFFELFGGFFAAGGKPPVGRVSVGGERGAELFAPEASHALRAIMYGPAPSGVQKVSGPTLLGAHGAQFFEPTVRGVVFTADETERLLKRFGGFFAGGGSPPVGMPSVGGEFGRELFLPRTHGMQPPVLNEGRESSASSGGDTYITVPVEGQVDRRTRYQIANDIALQQRRASRVA